MNIKQHKNILMTVRLSLLSRHALKYFLHWNSSLKNDKKCQFIINEDVEQSKINLQITGTINAKNCTRYCSKSNVDILHCGRIEV